MEEQYSKYQQGLAKQIQSLLEEALPYILEGSDCADEPLGLACDLCAEACPYCIDKGDLANAYIIVNSIARLCATLGNPNICGKQQAIYVADKMVLLNLFKTDLEGWINKGGIPQHLIMEQKRTGEVLDEDGHWINPNSIDTIVDKSWPQMFNSQDAKRLLQGLLDGGFCVPDNNRLKWVEGVSLWGDAMYNLCDVMGMMTEDGYIPWKMLSGLIVPKGNIQTAINCVHKLYGNSIHTKAPNHPKGYLRLCEIWGIGKK